MSAENFEMLKLENQLCFPLYACSKEIIRQYTPYLNKIGLTYTQYIVMMVLWEARSLSSKELGRRLFLDSGTLTPLLRKLEAKGFVERSRCREDERNLIVTITPAGLDLREQAKDLPCVTVDCAKLSSEDAAELRRILHGIMDNLREE